MINERWFDKDDWVQGWTWEIHRGAEFQVGVIWKYSLELRGWRCVEERVYCWHWKVVERNFKQIEKLWVEVKVG